MRNHHTKNKGDLGILKVQIDLYKQGYICYLSNSEHQNFDLIAYQKGGNFRRVQVKYRSLKNGILSVSMKQSWADKTGTHIVKVDKNEIDLYAVYCPDNDQCYYFKPEICNDLITLRILPTKNNQKKGIRLASDYERVP